MPRQYPPSADRRRSNFFRCAPGVFFTLRREADGRMSLPFVDGRLELLQGLDPDVLAQDLGPLLTMCAPDDLSRLLAALEQSARDLTPCRAEVRIGRSDGGSTWVELSGIPEPVEAEPGVVEWDGFLHDVTAQREETRLREQIQSVAQAVPGFLYTLRRDSQGVSTFPFVSDGIEALCGLRPSDIRDDATAIRKRYHPDDLPGLFARMEEAYHTLQPFRYEIRLSHPEQGMRWVEIRATLHRLPDGIVEAHGLMLDITDRKSAEAALENHYNEALRLNELLDNNARNLEEHAAELEATHEQLKATEAWYRGVIHSAPDGMLVIDQGGTIILTNKELQRMFGYSEQELVGQTLDVLIPPARRGGHLERRQALIRSTLSTKRIQAITDLRGYRRDGSEFDVDVTLSALPENDFNDETICIAIRDVSEQRLAEDRLRHALSFSEGIINAIPDLLLEVDRQGYYLNVWTGNPDMQETQKQALIGKRIYDILGPEAGEQAMAAIREADEKGHAFGHTIPIVQPNGELRWYEHSLSKKRGATGEQDSFIALSRDVTARIQVEAALSASEARARERNELLNAVMDSSPDVIVFALDRDYRYLAFNRQHMETMCAIWGKEIQTGMSMLEAIGAQEDRETARRSFDRTLAGESFVEEAAYGEERLSSKYWQTFWSPIRSESGEVTGLTCIVLDLSERKATELRLAETYQHLQTVLATIPDLVWLKDTEGTFLACNHAFRRIFGAEERDIIGKTDYDFIDKESADFFREKDRAAAAAGRVCINEEWVTYAETGERGLLETRKVPVYGPDGCVTGVLGVARDITERKQIENALAASEREFRALVENTPDTVARFGPDLRRKFVNPALATFLGKAPEALLGLRASEFPGGVSGKQAEEKLIEVFATGNPIEFEYAWHDKHGKEVCSLMRMAPEFNDEGEVKSVLAVGRDITELNAFRKKIHQMAFYDTLTGLPNRALFNDRLSQMITDASWHGQSAGVMMIDMDRFKAVNDTMGHAVGDELLCEAARRLTDCVRSYDTVARLGGDEFAVLLPDIRTGADLGRIASKMLDKFDERFLLDGKDIFVSCSIGIALYPDDSHDGQDLLKFADSAMYYAKRSGRNNFRFYAKDLTATAQARLTLEQDLRHARARGELALHYQPKISLKDGRLIGSEALLRWHHPQQGMIPPVNFIQIAEDTGLIVDIGEWVLGEACRVAAAWNTNGQGEHKVAINLSPRQFQSPHLIESVRRALEDNGCRPEWIELEITESLLLDEDGQVLDILRTFRDMGISIAIDDFGTGYSALSYLARFPIDTLKIDRSFINTVTTDHYRAELVRAILSIARCLHQVVVAEGVETADQAAFLAAHDCQIGQGFLFSKALPEAEFALLPRHFANT